MKNSQMKAGRFLKWQDAKKKLGWINAHFDAGRNVYVCTYTRSTRFKPKHRGFFKANRNGVWVARGKSWDCIDGCKLVARAD